MIFPLVSPSASALQDLSLKEGFSAPFISPLKNFHPFSNRNSDLVTCDFTWREVKTRMSITVVIVRFISIVFSGFIRVQHKFTKIIQALPKKK